MNIEMDQAERDTILAALRFWQANLPQFRAGTDPEFLDIATSGGEHAPMDENGIDGFCERLNCGDSSHV